ncbi:MAG: carbohydrate kinase family protein, partial [Candidatus Latescibacteria bacterium]|nr:carbohydrate kinase family protein [Candidatus Latescibacterota bacterium]
TFCGPVDSLPPEGALLALDALPNKVGGCAANVAIVLARQGMSVDVAGCMGDDGAGKVLRAELERQGVGCGRLSVTDAYPTSQTIILLIKGEDRRYFHVFGANRAFAFDQIDRNWAASLKAFYVGGLFAMPGIDLVELGDLLQFCRSRGVVTVVDVVMAQDLGSDPCLDAWLPHVDWFLPNDDEARLFTGEEDPEAQLRVLQGAGAKHVIITLGERGALAAAGSRRWRCGTYPVDAVDPSGSGDAFDAGVIAAAVRGRSVPDALRLGSALGASAVRAVGTTDGVFTAAEAEAYMCEHALEILDEH